MNCEMSDGELVVEHAGGDSVATDRITVQGEGVDASSVSKPAETFEEGKTITVSGVRRGTTVRLLWSARDSDEQQILIECRA